MLDLPYNLLKVILNYLELKDLLNIELINKFFCKFIRENNWNIEIYANPRNYDKFKKLIINHSFESYIFHDLGNINKFAKYLNNAKKIYLENSYMYPWNYIFNCNNITLKNLNNVTLFGLEIIGKK